MARELYTLLDRFIEQFADIVAVRAQQKLRFPGALARPCPAPGCDKPGAGPRNRWFCREHARAIPAADQKRILQDKREKLLEERRAEARARGSATAGRRLDMRCRVTGCKNRSRGPRFGYICDEHRKKLSIRQQQAAREKWNSTHTPKKAA